MPPRVIIAGGGFGGLATALTLHQIGVDCVVYESARELKPLGVGINIQPNAVRELFAMGIGADKLDTVGYPAHEWAMVGLNGKEIYAEPRGLEAGYKWPQYAVHRGKLQMLLHKEFVARAGDEAFKVGHRVTGYRRNDDGTVTALIKTADGTKEDTATLLIGADGMSSAIRAQMHPEQPPIHWGGMMLWRGVTRGKPLRTGNSFICLGERDRRMIIYPITPPDEEGNAVINWVAEYQMDNNDWKKAKWFGPIKPESYVHHFADFKYDWLDVPKMILEGSETYENAMVDRDPIPTWIDGPVCLMGDSAHVMYPVGSNGGSQAFIDARTIGKHMLKHGVTAEALAAFDAEIRPVVNKLILKSRGDGPLGLLGIVHDRCGGHFDHIDDVVTEEERNGFVEEFKTAAGFARKMLNARADLIPEGAKVKQT